MAHSLHPQEWVTQYADALYSYTLPRVNDQALAQDIVQETFLSAWKAREGYKGEASEKNWLFAICRNKIIDHYRRKSTDIMVHIDQDNTEDRYFGEPGHWNQQDEPADWRNAADGEVERKEFYQAFEGCRKKLHDAQQSVFAMKYLDDLDSAEICKTLGITPSNYWVLMHRAKLQLRNCLEKNWINPK
ncbi:sigma-70 family RNA polymerase sigma factor [Sediminibacterium soli]|uniref:sigma-70 family RNA polymerase sigma factor n=1 Tax=Sediminibacterium soli TaxID=2698829 RepID=UPI00137B5911|nr:sigma-70 family RNA polymerase sigma factor [Sediminibacterium soli]NCI46133.1 sigma-70 family RNA polymerase sigma factor [Sediminibacterium soli]